MTNRRVLRGGSWGSFADYCHSANRVGSKPSSRYDYIGFRAVRPVSVKPDASHVLRGGSWNSNVEYCRSADRDYSEPSLRYYDVGFRVVKKRK